jgi:hypothetical protein
MDHQQFFQSCIEQCYACADACDRCAIACLAEPNVKDMARCIRLDVDCAQMCRMAAGFMSRGSDMVSMMCNACAEMCDACGAECGRFQMAHCQECAAACSRCAEECRRMAASWTQQTAGAGAGSMAAH